MSRVPEMPQPLEHEKVAKRRALPARGRGKRAEVTLLDVAAKGLREPRLVRREGRLRVVATVDADGLDRRRRYDLVPVTKAKARDVDPSFLREGVDGPRPAGQRTVFLPKKAKPTHQLRPDREGEDLDVGGTIFGSDDRYLFDDRSFPWRTTGKVNTVGKWGSGTTIGESA